VRVFLDHDAVADLESFDEVWIHVKFLDLPKGTVGGGNIPPRYIDGGCIRLRMFFDGNAFSNWQRLNKILDLSGIFDLFDPSSVFHFKQVLDEVFI